MKNKSFKNYYDEIQVDENLLQQIPIKKHHYYKPILIISCVVLLFVLGIQNKETKDTFEILIIKPIILLLLKQHRWIII